MGGFRAGEVWCRGRRVIEGKGGRCEDGVAVSVKEGGDSEEVMMEDVVRA